MSDDTVADHEHVLSNWMVYDRRDYVLASVLGEQARTAGIKVPADALGQLREDA